MSLFKAQFIICLILCPLPAVSQHNAANKITLHGQVTDKTSGEPVEMATVHILIGNSNKLSGYAFTDKDGRFAIQTNGNDSLQISVSYLGYKAHKQPVGDGEVFNIKLGEEVFNLREVQVRPGRVWGTRDTINYDVTEFLSANDETIKDVIKKLPGIDVDEVGKISYNGKNISNLYVEGLDLSDGKYNKLTNNLQAKSVESVQLMQNHQPIRLLQNKVATEDVAMNIKLKAEFRDKWMLTLQGGAGFSPFLWNASANAMQLSRKSQSTYTYKTNNTGHDLVDELMMMVSRFSGQIREPETPSFVSQPSIMAPLRKDRLLFNDVHTVSGSRLYKINETSKLRINADYTHDVRKQERGSETSYFYPGDTVNITERSNTRIKSDEAEIKIHFENNATDKYLTNDFNANGSMNKSFSGILGTDGRTINQQIKTPEVALRNNLRCMWESSNITYEARSLLRYNHIPSELITGELKQNIVTNSFYTDNYFSALNKKGVFTQQYSAGVNANSNNIQNRYGIYLTPLWQLNNGKWQTNFSVPTVFTVFAPVNDFLNNGSSNSVPQSTSRIAANPSLSATYKLNYAWRFSLSARYGEQYGSVADLYPARYYTNYRHITQNSNILPVQQSQNYSVYGEYKNTIHEFFATLSLSCSRSLSNLIKEQSIEDDKVILSSHQLSNTTDSRTIRGTISKGFYDTKTKLSLDYLFSNIQSWQLNNGEKTPFEISYMQYEPKISQSLSRNIEVAYEARFRYGGSVIGGTTKLTPLWNTTQRLQLNYSISYFDIGMSADHYYNDLNDKNSMSAFFADAFLKWRHYDWQFTASASNLFNKRQYRYTQYSDIQSYTSWVNIRGREFLLSVRYRF